jgi:hypothetical protein
LAASIRAVASIGILGSSLACVPPNRVADSGDPPTDAVGIVVGVPCDLALRSAVPDWILQSLADGSEIARGAPPAKCLERTCLVSGRAEEVGTAIVVEVPGPHSEVPEEVWLGLVGEGSLAFVSAWPSEHAEGDVTRLGPVYGLAPFDCDGELVLRADARLPSAETEAPSAVLERSQGSYRVANGRALAHEVGPGSECRRLELELP